MKKKIASLIVCMGMMLSICASSSSAVSAEGPKKLDLNDCTESNGVYTCEASTDLIVSEGRSISVDNDALKLIINLNGHGLIVKGFIKSTLNNGIHYEVPGGDYIFERLVNVTSCQLTLNNLQISSGSLSPAFNRLVSEYSATVDSDTSRIDITVAKFSTSVATRLSINGTAAEDNTPVTVDLQYGLNQIPVTVTADNGSGYSGTYTLNITREPAPVVESESDDPGLQLVTFLDANGNTVKVEWVEYGRDAVPPTGYGTYTDYTNVTSHRDLKPIAIQTGNGYTVPCTADRS